MPVRAVDVRVTGRVQGVFFRASCEREARRMTVAGWVENAADGSVTGHFEGAADAVERLVDWCRQGPPHAQVAEVSVRDVPVLECADFDIR